jgi:hypothetical protein
MRTKKYRAGRRFRSLDHLEAWTAGGNWIMWAHTPKHPEIARNVSMGALVRLILAGTIREAYPNAEPKP